MGTHPAVVVVLTVVDLVGMTRFERRLGRHGQVSPRAESGSALHVHVNVRHAEAQGDALGAGELLAVWVSWVRFDLVTLFLARSW